MPINVVMAAGIAAVGCRRLSNGSPISEMRSIETVDERHHGQFDDLVSMRMLSGGFDVNEKSMPRRRTVVLFDHGPAHQATLHAEVA